MTTASQEYEQKREERSICLPVASAINESEATDYFVPDVEYQLKNCIQASNVDIVMCSRSGVYPAYRVQVTTIPRVTRSSDRLLRDDNDSVAAFEQNLTKALRERGLVGCQVSLDLTEAGVLERLRPAQMGQVADLIQRRRRGCRGSWHIDWREIGAFSEALALLVTDISWYDLSSDSVIVYAGRGCLIPEDRCFIDEAIRHKISRLGASKGVSNLALVIGASTVIDNVQEQINRYCSSFNLAEIPFSEVWIVSALSGQAIALKRRLTN